jgi:hypothetical protein
MMLGLQLVKDFIRDLVLIYLLLANHFPRVPADQRPKHGTTSSITTDHKWGVKWGPIHGPVASFRQQVNVPLAVLGKNSCAFFGC